MDTDEYNDYWRTADTGHLLDTIDGALREARTNAGDLPSSELSSGEAALAELRRRRDTENSRLRSELNAYIDLLHALGPVEAAVLKPPELRCPIPDTVVVRALAPHVGFDESRQKFYTRTNKSGGGGDK